MQQQQPSSTQITPAGSQAQPAVNTQTDATQQQSQNTLDTFMQLLTPKQDQQQQQQQQGQSDSLFGNVDKAALQQQIKNTNFTNGLDQQKVTAALGGDAGAFMEVLNSVAQNAFAASFQASQGMVEHGVKTGTSRLESGLDSRFRDFTLKQQNPTTDNPALKHPVGKAFFSSISQQIANANPQMSPAEVAKAAEEQLTNFAQMLAGPTQTQNSQQQSQSTQPDWMSFAS